MIFFNFNDHMVCYAFAGRNASWVFERTKTRGSLFKSSLDKVEAILLLSRGNYSKRFGVGCIYMLWVFDGFVQSGLRNLGEYL